MLVLRTNFTTVTGLTIKDGYYWDRGLPEISTAVFPISGVIYGKSPFTKVKFTLLTQVLAPYRTQTFFTFDCGDFYNETVTLSTFNPRPPIHPAEDLHGVVWQWSNLAAGPTTFRAQIESSFVVNNDDYSESTITLLSGGNITPRLSSYYVTYTPNFNINDPEVPDDFKVYIPTYNYQNLSDLQNAITVYERWPYEQIGNILVTKAYDLINIQEFKTKADILDTAQTNFKYKTNFYELSTATQLLNAAIFPASNEINTLSAYRDLTNSNVVSEWSFNNVAITSNKNLTLLPGLKTPDLNAINNENAIETYISSAIDLQTYYLQTLTEIIDYNIFIGLPTAQYHYLERRSDQSDIQGVVTATAFFKKETATKVRLSVVGLNEEDFFGTYIDVDLTTGTIISTNIFQRFVRAKIMYVGDNWWFVMLEHNQATPNQLKLRINILSNNNELLYIPEDPLLSGKGNSLFVYQPQLLIYPIDQFTGFSEISTRRQTLTRAAGYFVPFESDFYTFWLASSGPALLLMSTLEDREDVLSNPGRYVVASNDSDVPLPYGNNKDLWDYPSISNKTFNTQLTANRPMYFEIRHYQTNSYGYFNVGWSKYGNNTSGLVIDDTSEFGFFKKKWQREGYIATTDILHTYTAPGIYAPSITVDIPEELSTQYYYDADSASYEAVVINDEAPTAHFITLSSTFGYSPIEIEFSPKSTVTGTFPIEKIVWDFGDGSPAVTITRHTTTSATPGVIYYSNYPNDIRDPRNYHVKHTYVRNVLTDPIMYYPSLTAFSANTQSYTSCSREIGPIGTKKKQNKTLVKSRFYDDDNKGFLAFDIEGKTAFLKRDTNYIKLSAERTPRKNYPPNKLIYFNEFGTIYKGNSGEDIKNLLSNNN